MERNLARARPSLCESFAQVRGCMFTDYQYQTRGSRRKTTRTRRIARYGDRTRGGFYDRTGNLPGIETKKSGEIAKCRPNFQGPRRYYPKLWHSSVAGRRWKVVSEELECKFLRVAHLRYAAVALAKAASINAPPAVRSDEFAMSFQDGKLRREEL